MSERDSENQLQTVATDLDLATQREVLLKIERHRERMVIGCIPTLPELFLLVALSTLGFSTSLVIAFLLGLKYGGKVEPHREAIKNLMAKLPADKK